MYRTKWLRRTLPLAAVMAVAAGCRADDEQILSFPGQSGPNGLLANYVALGNSITAGYQSSGLNDSLQVRSYAYLLARKAGAQFSAPLIARPGCPRPFTAPLGATGRLGDTQSGPGRDSCVRINTPRIINNVAVPGERIRDLTVFPSDPSVAALNRLLIGSRTQTRAMIDAKPSFVSVWIGNNDVLEAAVSGNLGPRSASNPDSVLTPLASFQSSLNALVDSIKVANPRGAVLMGVVSVANAAPILQPGAYFFLARDPLGNFSGKPVNLNCSPVTLLGQPNPLAANLVSFQVVGDARFPEINCDPNAYPVGDPRRGVYLLDTSEQQLVAARVAAYNQAIQAAATANNWLYVDPNAVLAPLMAERDANGRYQRVRKCQDLRSATTPAQFQAAVLNSCPVNGPTGAPNFFGSLFSYDGVHPSTEAHQIVANALAAAINQKYGTTLPTS